MKTIKFSNVVIGEEFVFFGQIFHKIALGAAEDEERIYHLFLAETEVEVEEMELAAEPGKAGNGMASIVETRTL